MSRGVIGDKAVIELSAQTRIYQHFISFVTFMDRKILKASYLNVT